MEHLEVLEYHLHTSFSNFTKRLFLISLVFLFSNFSIAYAENFTEDSKIIKKVKIDLKTNPSTKEFWEKIKEYGTPLIESTKDSQYIATFLYKGAKKSVLLIGGPDSDFVNLKQIEKSDIWYKSYKVKKGVRLSYKLSADTPTIKGTKREKRVAIYNHSKKDPFNKLPYMNNSSFSIISDNFIDWTKDTGTKQGKVKDYKIKSKILNNTREISIYTPYNYDPNKEHDLLFVFDSKAYQSKVPTPIILDNLINEKKIKPTIAVFISNISRKSRSEELPPNKNFADFLAKELLPFVKTKVKINHKKENTILTGSSYGGLASAYVAFIYPEIFGKVLSQSGSFWWNFREEGKSQWLTKQFEKAENKEIVFYLNAGVYETGQFKIDILESNRYLYKVLKKKNYEVKYEEFQTSHDYFAWRAFLAYGLIYLNSVK